MKGRDDFFPPSAQSRRQPQLANVIAPELGGMLTKWHYHFQAQTAQKQDELFNALETLFKSQQRAVQANQSLELALIDLEFLEDYKELRRDEIRAEILLRRNALATELFNRGVDCTLLMRAAKEKLYPTPVISKPSEPKTDHRAEKIKNTMNGGGHYTKMAEALEAELIKTRGGKSNLEQQDIDRIKNAYKQASQFDEGQG